MKIQEKIEALRQGMADRNIAALVIPSADPHQSEYVPEHWQARAWVSGFTGSAGTAVITRDKALVWTDFRYWIQAEAQMGDSEFELVRSGDTDVVNYDQWLADTLEPGEVISIFGELISASQAKDLRKKWEPKELVLETQWDLVAELWEDRPPMPDSRAFDFSCDYAGENRKKKLSRIRETMAKKGADFYLITALEDVAWVFNLRGRDMETNPVNIAFALVGKKEAQLFIPGDKVGAELGDALKEDGVACLPYGGIKRALEALPEKAGVLLDPVGVNWALYNAVPDHCRIIEVKIGPAAEFKTLKNSVEIAHLRETAVKDGAAMVNFLYWLDSAVARGERVTETLAGEKVKAFRQEQEGFVDNSFDPIMAHGAHSAMCHYSATPETELVIGVDSLFLNDSGGNYLTGTTDITRTLSFGEPTLAQKRDYTLVLKGHIALSTAHFPVGTRGVQLDTLARQPLWQAGMDFGHGTGHGIGFFLCVHEGPARISPHPVDVALKPGMLLSNEPGVYREGEYGIRLENMVLVREENETLFGQFLGFANLTLCHFERGLVDMELLDEKEVEWINAYHGRVWEQLSPRLEGDVLDWLRNKTLPL